MKRFIIATALIAFTAAWIGAQAPSTVTYKDHDAVAAAIANGGQLASGPDFAISVAKRTGPGQVEVHDKETDVIYVVDGAATFVTGGKMVGGKVTKPGQSLGSDIIGGQTHHLGKGDVIVVPATTPHWFKEVPQSVSYFVVKVLKQ